jgi:nucleoside phosphorylase
VAGKRGFSTKAADIRRSWRSREALVNFAVLRGASKRSIAKKAAMEAHMPSEEEIADQKTRLATYRRTLAVYLKQRAAQGEAYVQPGVIHGIDDARGEIQHIKEVLRSWSVSVDDHPDDAANQQVSVPDQIQLLREAGEALRQDRLAHAISILEEIERTLSGEPRHRVRLLHDLFITLAAPALPGIEEVAEAAFQLWKKYDEDVREIAVPALVWVREEAGGIELLRRRFNAAESKERRLLRDSRLQGIAPDLAQHYYQWSPLQSTEPTADRSEIIDWLTANGLRYNPFGSGFVESDPLLLPSRTYPTQWNMLLMSRPTLIQGSTHQDRIAARLFLEHTLQTNNPQLVFPVELLLPFTDGRERNRRFEPLRAITHAVGVAWITLLARNPATLLELPLLMQEVLAELCLWVSGSYESLCLRLIRAGLPEDADGDILLRRLAPPATRESQARQLNRSKLRDWLLIRPPGLLDIYVIVHCWMAQADKQCQQQAASLLKEAAALARVGVIVKLFMPIFTPALLPEIDTVTLSWDSLSLEKMLRDRLMLASNNTYRAFKDLFGPILTIDPDQVLLKQAGSSLSIMLDLGRRVIQNHVNRSDLADLEYKYLDQDDLEVIQQFSASIDRQKTDTLGAAPTIAIITALPQEYAAVKALLENQQDETLARSGVSWQYLLGDIPATNGGRHSLVLSMSGMGTNLAASCATFLVTRFPTIDTIIMVGIAGGVPNPEKPEEHVRLGDIVVSNQYGTIQYDFIKQVNEAIEYRNPPRPPSASLLYHVNLLAVSELEGNYPWRKFLGQAARRLRLKRPLDDILASTSNPPEIVAHPKDQKRRSKQPRVFIGPIASSNKLLKSARERDELRDRFKVKAIEMEGAGIADAAWSLEKKYLIIRGICDYCDENKNDAWQAYAAVVAAAYMRALIESIPVSAL